MLPAENTHPVPTRVGQYHRTRRSMEDRDEGFYTHTRHIVIKPKWKLTHTHTSPRVLTSDRQKSATPGLPSQLVESQSQRENDILHPHINHRLEEFELLWYSLERSVPNDVILDTIADHVPQHSMCTLDHVWKSRFVSKPRPSYR